jgi:hypothetical protein
MHLQTSWWRYRQITMVKVDGQLHLLLFTEDPDSEFSIVVQADLVGNVMHGLDITILGEKHHFGPHVEDSGDLLRDLSLALYELALEVNDQTGRHTCLSEFSRDIPFKVG